MLRLGRTISRAINRGLGNADSVDVSEVDGVRSLYLGSETVQSSMRIKAPYDLELTYSRAMMLFLLFLNKSAAKAPFENKSVAKVPVEVLMIGLGGGSVAKYVHHYLPQIKTRVVEINEQIIRIARSHFYLPEDDERLQVIVGDGVAYLEEHVQTADVLLLDVFDSKGVPTDMYNQAFFDSCAESLKLDGMMAVNLWGSDRNFDIYLQRIEQSFNQRVLVLRTGKPGNIVVFGFKRAPADLRWASLRQRAKELETQHEIEFLEFVEKLREHNPNTSNRLLLGE
ncbi:MAG: polyamine aminopropyltransferase [Pseudomonadota bacterium]